MMMDNRTPITDAEALSSPSGRMSKAARDRAEKRLREELFPDGVSAPKSPRQVPKQRARILRDKAADLRHLAAMGMRPRVHTRAAEKLEREADSLDGGPPG